MRSILQKIRENIWTIRVVFSLDPPLAEEAAIARGRERERERGGKDTEMRDRRNGGEVSTRERDIEKEWRGAREMESPSRGRVSIGQQQNYPLAGDFAVCEGPTTYESSPVVLSLGARGPTRIPLTFLTHARKHAGRHARISVRSPSFTHRHPRRVI